MPAQPFLDVSVQPLWGKFRCLIKWKVADEFKSSNFAVLKSPDGVNNWTPIAAVPAEDQAVDEHLIHQGKLHEHFYQVVFFHGTKMHKSPVVGTFGTVSRAEFGAARRIMEMEYQSLRMFTPVFLFKLRAQGPPCPLCVDPDTGQSIGASTCIRCYGTRKDGGYWPKIPTHMRILTTSPTVRLDKEDGTGTIDPIEHKVRMLAFPYLRKEDLLVHKEADRRYLVNDIEYAYLGGKVPVTANVSLTLLRTVDIRYQLPV